MVIQTYVRISTYTMYILYILVHCEFSDIPCIHHLDQSLLNTQLLVSRGHYVRDGLGKVMQLHSEEVLQSEGLRIHVEVLLGYLHQFLPVPLSQSLTFQVGKQWNGVFELLQSLLQHTEQRNGLHFLWQSSGPSHELINPVGQFFNVQISPQGVGPLLACILHTIMYSTTWTTYCLSLC